MSFDGDGFFSLEVEAFRRDVRENEPFKAWFDYALDLNRLGFGMLRGVKTSRDDNRLITLNALFVRVHHSFQSALILAERGLITDARAVLRSGVESAIAINALAKDAGFVDQMIEAHHRSQRTLARTNLKRFVDVFSAEEKVSMNKAIADANAHRPANGKELTDIKWEQVADKYCPELYQLLYRDLSSDGTHATINVLKRFLVVDLSEQITAFKVAPDTEGLEETLKIATLVFTWSAIPYADLNGLSDETTAITERVQQFATLPGAFPREVAVA